MITNQDKLTRLWEDPSDIRYIEGFGDYIKVYRGNGDRDIYQCSMKKFISRLGDEFIRIHRSYIINSKYMVQYCLRSRGYSRVKFNSNKGFKVFSIGASFKKRFIEYTIKKEITYLKSSNLNIKK